MGTASGILKQLKYKVEVTFGTVPVAASAQLLRRVASSLELSKDTYQSNEIRDDYQLSDFRHGVRRVSGTISGELSPKTYADFFAAALKKDFVAGVSATGLSITIAGTPGAYTITRSAGSWITDGFKVGDVMRLTAGAFNAANLNKNLLIHTLTATIATVLVLNASTLTAEGPIAAATAAVTGKKTFTPSTGHTDKSFSIEHWFPDVPTSEVFSGCKVQKFSIGLPPTGIATVGFDFIGKDIVTSASEYFTSPTAATTTSCLAAVNGVLRIGGVTVANITGLSLDVNCGQSGEPTVGANTVSALTAQRVIGTGQFTATFDATTYRDAFVGETEVAIIGAFTADNTANADFVAFNAPRVKLGSASKDDGEKTIVVTCSFQILKNNAGGTGTTTDQTSLAIQDSAA
jgi:hypothetical protein